MYRLITAILLAVVLTACGSNPQVPAANEIPTAPPVPPAYATCYWMDQEQVAMRIEMLRLGAQDGVLAFEIVFGWTTACNDGTWRPEFVEDCVRCGLDLVEVAYGP